MSYTPIELDKMRNFKYGMRAISLIEKKFKKPIMQIDLNNLYMEEVATIIWAGLVHEDKGLTVDKTMDIVDNAKMSIEKVFMIASDALIKAFADEEEEVEKND